MSKITVTAPCRMNDMAWCIRNYRGVLHPAEGRVREMYFNDKMEIIICLGHIGRGKWGEQIFETEADAQKAIDRRNNNV